MNIRSDMILIRVPKSLHVQAVGAIRCDVCLWSRKKNRKMDNIQKTSLSRIIRIILLLSVICTLIAGTSCNSEKKRRTDSFSAYNRGIRAVKANNLDLGSFYFKKALILNPEFTEARLNLANTLFLKGDFKEAQDLYGQLLKDKEEDPRVLFNLGSIYSAKGNYEIARECFVKSRKADPGFADADYGFGMMYVAQKEDELAKFHLENYIKNNPDGRWIDKAKTELESLTGIKADDVSPVIDPLQNVPVNPIAEADLTPEEIPSPQVIETPAPVVKPEVKEPSKESVVTKPKATEQKPSSNVKNTKPPVKEQKPSKVEEIRPEQIKPLSQILADGWSALQKGDLKKAEKEFKSANSLEKDSAEAAKGLAKVYYVSGRYPEEKKYIDLMIKRKGGNPNDPLQLADGFEQIGNIQTAIKYYRDYLSKNPFGEKAEFVKKKLTELDEESSKG
jgi:tetratricopeptide (TPR) repeat protein